jgi:Domain of unknown function (DUF6484)
MTGGRPTLYQLLTAECSLKEQSMDSDSKDLMVVELEPDAEIGEFVEETPDQDLPRAAVPSAGNVGVLIGKLTAWDDAGNPLVDYPNNPSECFLPARTTVPLNQTSIGREVALVFVNGDPWQPLIIGLLQPPQGAPPLESRPALAAEIDGERLVFTAKQEIVLQCGQASLTLTNAGKVLIRGAYLLSRSSGVNRIQGGSVQLN